MTRILSIAVEEGQWVQARGTTSDVVEKRLLNREDEFPISASLRRFKKQAASLSRAAHNLVSHSSLELSFVVAGRFRARVEGVGDVEASEGTLIVIPAGQKHGVTEVLEDTTVYAGFFPPYDRQETSGNETIPSVIGEFLLVRAEDTPTVSPWAPVGMVTERRLLTKEDGYGVGFTLRYIPSAEDLAAAGRPELQSADGYRFHSHPCLEAAYIVKGRNVGFIETEGDENASEGVFIAVPAHQKHGGKKADTRCTLAVINVPPFGRQPFLVERDGVTEEG